MIDWIDQAGKAWGTQRRRILLGGYSHDGGFHHDGYPARSILAKLREEREGAAHANTGTGQHYAEVLRGDALAFRRALDGAPGWAVAVATMRYVVPKRGMPTKAKVQEIRKEHPEINCAQRFYEALERLHVYLQARWPVECLPAIDGDLSPDRESVRTK